MGKKQIWISPRPDGDWEVQRAGSKKPLRVTSTQKEAIEIGRDQAINGGDELIIQSKRGPIRQSNSYGNDPNPPKDKD